MTQTIWDPNASRIKSNELGRKATDRVCYCSIDLSPVCNSPPSIIRRRPIWSRFRRLRLIISGGGSKSLNMAHGSRRWRHKADAT